MNKPGTPEIAGMFDRISKTYDFLNHFLSLGVDRHWRNTAIRKLFLTPEMTILDCGAGTGDMALAAHRLCSDLRITLLDPAQDMLLKADTKAGVLKPEQYLLVRGAAEYLPFPDALYDRFMIAFGIRNFANLETGLRGLHRVLKRNGRGVILEFTPDRSRWLDRLFQWYMRHVMEPLGAAISRDREAYIYLTRTVENFATSAQLTRLLSDIGFVIIENVGLSGGIARLFVLEKR